MVVFFIILMIQNYLASPHVETITYGQFKSLVKKGLVSDLVIGERPELQAILKVRSMDGTKEKERLAGVHRIERLEEIKE
jgi:hypothetical protein